LPPSNTVSGSAPPPGAHSACPDRCGNVNAAGRSWFVHPTAGDDSEFTMPGNQGEMNRMDLLTVLEHELDHMLGSEHTAPGVVPETVLPGSRCVPSSGSYMMDVAVLDWVFANSKTTLAARFLAGSVSRPH
jgi:hypothetical protein